jgi:outer membrane biosynthesis protein TonB
MARSGLMDRAEKAGLGVAVAGHAVLLGVLSLGFASVRQPPITNEPIEVSIVDEVALRSAAPSAQAPAPSIAPELGPPEQAAPAPAPLPVAPELPPPPPEPAPIPPTPQPKVVTSAPPRPLPPKQSAPVSPPPRSAAKPAVKAAPPRAAPKGKAAAERGSILDRNILAGIGNDPAPAEAPAASGAVLSSIALSGIRSAIQRQVQPCADRQIDPGPGASQITVTLNLRLNRDGSLSRRPEVVRVTGVTDENGRYKQQVTDRAVASYTGCAPLRGLPDDLYQTASGGWSNINMNYKLPG